MNWSSGHHHFAHSADDQRPKLTYEQLRWAMDVALESGVGVLSCGGSVAKATRFVRQILSGFQIAAVDIDVTVNILTITVRPDAQAYPLTVMRVAPVGHQDFVRINLLEDFVNRFSADPERLPQASQRITEILASPPSWHRVKEAFALGAIAAAATLMLGGTFLIAAIAGGTATAIQFLQSWLATRGTAAFFQQAVGGSIAASAALLAAWLRQLNVPGFAEVHPGLVVIGSIVAMLAGLSVLGAAEDAIVGNYLSGGVHALQGIIQTLGIVAGISAVLTGAHHVGISVDLAYTISLTGLLSVSSAFWAGLVALGYGVYSRANMVTMLINLVLGGFAWAMMLRLLEVGWGQVSASAAVATVVGLVAGLLSAGLKVPHYAFSTAIVVPLLPGLLVYQGLMALMNDGAGFLAGQQTLNIAAGVGLALAAGVAVGAAVMKVLIPQRHLEPESHTTIT